MDWEEHSLAILLVDDEVRLRQVLARILTMHGHRIDQASTCREALDAIATRDYDLLLLDVNLPDDTGWEVLRQLRVTNRSVPTVVISAAPASAARVHEFGPVGVLHKPFPVEALLRFVRGADEPEQASSNGSES